LPIKVKDELFVINILTVLLILVINFSPSDVPRAIFGLPVALFLPGYTLLATVFPQKGKLSGLQRVALSFGLSATIVPVIGLIFNYTQWGIRLEPVLYSVAAFIFITSSLAMLRRNRLPEQERFSIDFRPRLPGLSGHTLDKFLSVILIVSIVGALGTLGYAIATPRSGEKFTTFYILGLHGEAEDYPAEFIMEGDRVVLVKYGDTEVREVASEYARVTLGIVNHEHEQAAYLIRVTIDGEQVAVSVDGNEQDEIGLIELAHEEKWEHAVRFAPQHTGDSQKVSFVLYKNGVQYFDNPPYLWVDVTE